MATFYDKYARLEVLESGSDVTHAASTCTLFASGTAAAATLYFFKGDGTKVDMAGGSTMTADGDTGGTVSVDLSTDTFDIAGGTGCDTVIAKSGTDVTLTINLDIGEITEAAIDVTADYGVFIDGGATGTTRKDSWADISAAQCGTVTSGGLAADEGRLKVDLQNWTASTSVVDADLLGIDDGANGTLRKMTRANFLGSAAAAFSNGMTATSMSGSTSLNVGTTAAFANSLLTISAAGVLSGSATATFDNMTLDDLTAGNVDINGGAIDGTIVGANSAAAGTFAALVGTSLSVSDGNITNVGVLECDTVQSDADAAGLNLNFDGNTGTNLISMAASLASALDIKQDGGDSYLKFLTSDGYISAGKELAMSAGTSIGASGWIRFGNNSSSPDSSISQHDGGKFKALVISGSSGADGLPATGLTYVSGNLSASGDVSLGTSNANTITPNGTFKGAVMPSADDTYDLGHASYQWQDLYITGKAYIDQLGEALDCDSQAMTNVNVDSGAVDGTIIGANSAAAGTFAALVGTSLNCSDGNITNVGDINCDSVSVDAAAAGLTVDGSGANTTLFKITMADNLADALNINEGGTSYMKFTTTNSSEQIVFGKNSTFASTTIADLGAVTTVDINGGTADAVVLGGATPAAATVTTLQCNSAVTCGSDGSGVNFTLHGGAANEDVIYSAANHTLTWTDSSDATHITIGGDATGEYAIDVATGSNAKNKMRAAAFVTYSDERLKNDIKPLRNALKTVNSLKAVNFTWKSDGGKDFGFLAQDLKKVIPQAVHGNDEGFFGVDYGRLTAVLVSAIQEQSLEIEALKAEMKNK
jgi:hypothetical protein